MRRPMTPDAADVVRYYDDMTASYMRYGGETFALHTGLFDSTTNSKMEALLLSNHLLVQGLDLGPDRRVLDAGCGLGGLAIYLARKFRVNAVGITLCAPHVEIASRNAKARGLEDLVRIQYMDYMNMNFPDNHFDAVLSQDAFCYASDMEGYFRGVNRVLKPGGSWRAIDAFRARTASLDDVTGLEEVICRGWKTPVFSSWREVRATMERAGFDQFLSENLSPLAEPASKDFIKEKLMWDLAVEFQGVKERNPEPVFRDHMAACAAFGAGVLDGTIQYLLVGGRKI